MQQHVSRRPRALVALLASLAALGVAFPAPASATLPHFMDPATIASGEEVSVTSAPGGVGSLILSALPGDGMAVTLDSDPQSRLLVHTDHGGKILWCFSQADQVCDRPAVVLETPGDFNDNVTALTEQVALTLGPLIDGAVQSTRNRLRVEASDVARLVWSAGMNEVPSSSPDPTAQRGVEVGASILVSKDSDDLIVELPEGGDLFTKGSIIVESNPTVYEANFDVEPAEHQNYSWPLKIRTFPAFSEDEVMYWAHEKYSKATIIEGDTILPEHSEDFTNITFTNVAGRTLHLVGAIHATMHRVSAPPAFETAAPVMFMCFYKPSAGETSFSNTPYEFVSVAGTAVGERASHTYERLITLAPGEVVRVGIAAGAGNPLLESTAILGKFEFRELH